MCSPGAPPVRNPARWPARGGRSAEIGLIGMAAARGPAATRRAGVLIGAVGVTTKLCATCAIISAGSRFVVSARIASSASQISTPFERRNDVER